MFEPRSSLQNFHLDRRRFNGVIETCNLVIGGVGELVLSDHPKPDTPVTHQLFESPKLKFAS
jgi:hypothetical protein